MASEGQSWRSCLARFGARSLYIFTGIMCCILGIVGAIGFSVICVFAGVFLVLTGIFILIIEMPFCCAFIPQTEYISRGVDKMGPLPIGIICGASHRTSSLLCLIRFAIRVC
uniref:Calcium channel flower n=1 Tax=Mesocestoides corti TaxID=53468 RepID=A0A5K3FMR4_MESCO